MTRVAWGGTGRQLFTRVCHGDHRVCALQAATDRLQVVYDAATAGADAPLRDPDNVTAHPESGDVFVAEGADDLELVLRATAAGERIAAPFLQLVGHAGSEVAGPAFSPDGTRPYFSSQRGAGGRSSNPGLSYEVSGPFRTLARA